MNENKECFNCDNKLKGILCVYGRMAEIYNTFSKELYIRIKCDICGKEYRVPYEFGILRENNDVIPFLKINLDKKERV